MQIDETAFAKFGDPDVRAMLNARGDDPDALIERYIAVTNRAVHGAIGHRDVAFDQSIRIIAARVQHGAHVRVAELRERRLVDLHVAASGGAEPPSGRR